MQHIDIEVPDTGTILDGMHLTLYRRRRQKTIIGTVACLLLASIPLATLTGRTNPSPTLVEAVSANITSSSSSLPAPLAGYQNSIRNHQTKSII